MESPLFLLCVLQDRKRIVYCNPSLPSKAKAVHILLFRYRDRWLQHNPVVTRACRKAHMASEIQNLNAKEVRQFVPFARLHV